MSDIEDLRNEAVSRFAVSMDVPAEIVAASDYEEPECWCEWVDIGVGMQRVAENYECPQHFPHGPEDGFYDALGYFIKAMHGALLPICPCPTATHRMNCGIDATPRVVTDEPMG